MAGLVISLPACENTNDQSDQESPSAEIEHESLVDSNAVPMPMNLNGQIAFAKKDLVERLGVLPESVRLSSANAVTWRSGALGCPDPEKMYTMALVTGSVIYLQADNMIYAYHAKFAQEPFYCPRERVEPPVLNSEDDLT